MGLLTTLAPFVPAIGSAIGGAFGYSGAKESARMSRDMAREQMDFQERMSNTAFQRSAEDLEKAGLNRILAFGSPASSPAGAQGNIPDFGAATTAGLTSGSNVGANMITSAKLGPEIANLLASADVTVQKGFQEMVKTGLWQEVGKTILDTATGINETVDVVKEVLNKGYQDVSPQAIDTLNFFINHIYEPATRAINPIKGGVEAGSDFIDFFQGFGND